MSSLCTLNIFGADHLLRYSNVIWLADTNYRIDLENEVARYLANNWEFDQLVAADQVSLFNYDMRELLLICPRLVVTRDRLADCLPGL